jgi:uncharacterized protein
MQHTETRPRPPLSIWVLSGLLAVLVCSVLALLVALWWQKAHNAAVAFETGRFVKILIASGEMESKVPASARPMLDKEAYRAARVKEITGSLPEVKATPTITPAVPKETAEPAHEDETQPNRSVQFPLAPAPAKGLIDQRTDGQALPVIAEDGRSPWREYAKPYVAPPKGARLLSLVITNVGLNEDATRKALQLDERVTLAFSPYASELREQVKQARANGFETWLTLPLQHENYPVHDYGALTLLNTQGTDKNLPRLRQILGSADGIVGLIAMPDEAFSTTQQMQEIYAELAGRGVLLTLYSHTFTPEKAETMLLHSRPHVFSGNIPPSPEMWFTETEAYIAGVKRTIITVAPMPAVMERLHAWIATLPEKNIALVPLTAQAGALPVSPEKPAP